MKRLLAAALALLLLCGCTLFAPADQAPEDARPQEDGADSGIHLDTSRTEALFTLGYSPDLSLNPYLSRSTVNWTFLPLLYEGLFQLTPGFEAEPLLCQSYEASADGRTWTFTLRQDAAFSNGVALTAADVVYSLELARKSDLYAARLACVDTIVQASQNQVVLTLRQAMGSLPLLLDVPVIRADSVQSPLGTGPYVLIQTADEAYLEHVSGWRGGEAPIGRIYLHAVDNTDSVRDAFEFGRISLVVSDLNTVGAVNFHSNYELWSQDTMVMQFLSFNGESPLFQSAVVRAAVTHAIDRQGLITEYFDGYGVAATLPMQPRCPSYFASLADDYGPRDGTLAGAVAEAGLTGRRGTLLVNSDNATNAAAAEAIAASLRESGLEIEVLTAAGSNYDSLVELGGYDLLYCEVRLTADFDLSAFFGGALSDYAIQHDDAPALCAAAMENSGNFYDLHRLIMDEGLLCPILFKTRAVMTDRGSVSGLTPAPVNVFYQLDRLSILTGGAKEESQ